MVAKSSTLQILKVAPAVRPGCHEALGRFPLARIDLDATSVTLGVCHHEYWVESAW